MLERAVLVELVKRLLAHKDAGTTESVADTLRVPIATYEGEQRLQRELDVIHRRKPMPLAMTAELREPGSYKAMEAFGRPVLIVRGDDGQVRAFLNVCRHRGMIVVPDGCGSARRFTCLYHAWSYGQRGELAGVYAESTFGEVDRAERSLVSLPCEERGGFVWVVVTPDEPMDLDAWLGDYGDELTALGLDEWHVFEQRELDSPNWKVAFDGYLEGYHFASLHRNTVGKQIISNLMVSDFFGPHQRNVFATKAIDSARGTPEDDWVPRTLLSPVYIVWPFMSMTGVWNDHAMITQLFPGPTAATSRTVQTFVARHPVDTPDRKEAAAAYAELLHMVVRDEDYTTASAAASTLASGANDDFLLGRNELTLHHHHRWLQKLLEEAGDAASVSVRR